MCNFLFEISTFKQAIKLTFGRNKFGRWTVFSLQTRIHFLEKVTYEQIDKIIDQFYLSKNIISVTFNFISFKKIFKKYVIKSNSIRASTFN